ncbi:MAG: hypothetical protein M1831_007333 [Alyxoria varia]|nr:MAG: hypothetical protein M1831_007333 [Alyxoria varia]
MSFQVVIVTGASRGLGHAVVSLLAKPLQHCRVLAVARSLEPLKKLQEEYGEDRVQVHAGDLTNADAGTTRAMINLAVEKWGKLDALVLNHGAVEPVERIENLEMTEWKEAFDVNFFSALALIKEALGDLRKSHGRIIITSSGAAVKGTASWGPYGASKAMLNSLARTIAAEEPDITTVAIRPGVVDTQMQETLAREHYSKMEPTDTERFKKMKEEGTMLRPEQPGNVIGRLALDAGSDLSGKFLDWNDKELGKFQDL